MNLSPGWRDINSLLTLISYELFQNTTYKYTVKKSEWSWLNLLTLVNNTTFWEVTLVEIY
jgi:hypothetical protein